MGRTRKINGLQWVRSEGEVPGFACGGKAPKGKSSIKQGHSYEKRFATALQKAIRPPDEVLQGTWLRFSDNNGLGWAQPDVMLFRGARLFLFECKLTENNKAWVQLLYLYTPLLQALYPGKEIIRVQVCKNLKFGGSGQDFNLEGKVITKPSELKDGTVWHWR